MGLRGPHGAQKRKVDAAQHGGSAVVGGGPAARRKGHRFAHMIRPERLTVKAGEALQQAVSLAATRGNPVANDAHLFLALRSRRAEEFVKGQGGDECGKKRGGTHQRAGARCPNPVLADGE